MKPVRVLLTCLGGRFSLNTVRALQQSKDPKIKVIGVDTNLDIAGRYLVESFYTVPCGSDEGYIPEILRICKKENIDIVIPCADEEASAISRNKKLFNDEDIICAVDKFDNVFLVKDTFELFKHLSEHNVPMPKYRLVRTVEEVEDFADYVGYPQKKFVLKPTTGRGARGVHIIGEDGNEETPLENVCQTLGVRKNVGGIGKFSYLAMEYLPGDAYDVDVLAEDGRSLCSIPRRRLWKNKLSPFSEGCIIEKNKELTDFVSEIVKLLGLNYAYDFDCGTTTDGKPAIYEINPRFSGAIAASVGAGVNIPVMLVKVLLGMKLPKCDIKYGTRMHPTPNGNMEFTYEEKVLCK